MDELEIRRAGAKRFVLVSALGRPVAAFTDYWHAVEWASVMAGCELRDVLTGSTLEWRFPPVRGSKEEADYREFAARRARRVRLEALDSGDAASGF